MFYYIYFLSLFSLYSFYFSLFPGILEFWCLVTVIFKFTVLYNNIYRKKIYIDGFLVTTDIEKAFDPLNHSFLLAALKKFGFGTSFVNWIGAILNQSESCVINSAKTAAQYFQLNRGASQGDAISTYLFISVIKVLFTLIKNNEKNSSIRYTQLSFSLFNLS